MGEIVNTLFVSFWGTLAEMSPYLLFGFFAAGVLSVFISPELVERHLGGRGFWPLLKASAFGVPLPLCSCGVIPVSMSLRKHGASKGATISFLLSTPQTGVDSILVTLSLLGPVYAIFRPLAALVTGLLGGGLVSIFEGKEYRKNSDVCTDSCCAAKQKKNAAVRALRYGFVNLPRDIGRSMLVGLFIAAIISAAVPEDFFAPFLGGGIVAMVLMSIMGIPVYVCATASVPVAAALIAKGVSPGVALVFLMTGPATNAAALVTIWAELGKRTALVYIVTVAVAAIGFGLLLDVIIEGMNAGIVMGHGWMMPEWVKNVCAVGLLAILGVGAVNKGKK